MSKVDESKSFDLADHFFRDEYGKLVAVVTKYIGNYNISTAEDIVQETLLKAVENWHLKGIPENPSAWLFKTAKNITLNQIKKSKIHNTFLLSSKVNAIETLDFQFSEEIINDEQLRVMFSCCQSNISEETQISLILKIFCGFSISEIASAFLTSKETINKRLVRGRKNLRSSDLNVKSVHFVNENLDTLLKTIYLIFNEGYCPSNKEQVTNNDLCLEAIRLTNILIKSNIVNEKSNAYALLALMYFNISRFNARVDPDGLVVELKDQDRGLWNQTFINQGIFYLNKATRASGPSKYLILATISANYCIASSYEDINWSEILELYDSLIQVEYSPLILLNRAVVLSKVLGSKIAIEELQNVEMGRNLEKNHLYHITLAEFYKDDNQIDKANKSLERALKLSNNKRDKRIIQKKIDLLVPVS